MAQVKSQIAFDPKTTGGAPLLKVCGDINRLSYREYCTLANAISDRLKDYAVDVADVRDALLGATDALLAEYRE